MIVREIMTHSPLSISSHATVSRAWSALRELDVRHLPVINEDRELVGILSDRDLAVAPRASEVTEIIGPGRLQLDQPVATIMSSDVISIGPDDEVDDAIDLMLQYKIGAIPVVTPEQRVIGMVSYIDVLRSMVDERP